LGRKAELIGGPSNPRRAARIVQSHQSFALREEDHANLIETFWQLRFQLAEMLVAGAGRACGRGGAGTTRYVPRSLKNFFKGWAIDERISS
jgi:hypothetical protein